MNKHIDFAASVFSGAVTGFVILGLIGRLAMALVSLSIGAEVHFSLGGLLQIALITVMIGAAGGMINYVLSRILNVNTLAHALLLGIILFSLSLIFSVSFTQMKISMSGIQLLTLAVVLILYFIYGYTINVFISYCKNVRNRNQ